jgi:hypothetical protein
MQIRVVCVIVKVLRPLVIYGTTVMVMTTAGSAFGIVTVTVLEGTESGKPAKTLTTAQLNV